MKLIHTSDWHLGHALYTYDRTAEQQAFLEQLAQIVAKEKPDAMVVSGDIYHYSAPSAATQRMYTDAMLNIHAACPEMTIVVTAGNHDSSSKLEIDSNLWDHFGVKVIGNIERISQEVNLERHIVEVKDVTSRLKGYILAVPHIYPQNFPALDEKTPREERQSLFFQTLLDKVKERNTKQLPVVLMAHLSVEGSDRTGHNESTGGIEYFPLSTLGEGYDYLALGHIHCPQNIKGSRRARYCGTPIPVSFDETYPHSVSIVNLEHGEEPQIKTIEITNQMPLVTLPKEAVPFDEALKLLEEFPDDRPAYIRLNVLMRGINESDWNERAAHATKGKACKYCCIKSNRETREADSDTKHITLQELQEMSPVEIAKRYYQEREGEELDEELCKMLTSITQKIKEVK